MEKQNRTDSALLKQVFVATKVCHKCNKHCFALHPKASYWSTTKNNNYTPHDFSLKTRRKFWFDCTACLHSFDTALCNVNRGDWCPYCVNRKRCPPETIESCAHCWKGCFASHSKSDCWSLVNIKGPRECSLKSDEKFWFECEKCHHHFQAGLGKITTRGQWCPYCANRQRCPPETIEACTLCWNRCFASHPKATQWSIERNEITPREVALNDNRKFWFDCDKCHHSIAVRLLHINTGQECPFCANKRRCQPLTIESCKQCWKKCFASHPMARYWSDTKNVKSPREVALNDNRKFWFTCDKCHHSFNIALNSVNQGHWCPFCANRQRCPPATIESCAHCWGVTFASHPKAVQWSSVKNEKTTLEVALNSHLKYWFDCDKCHKSFNMSLDKITDGQWCQFCKHKTEALVFDWCLECDPTAIRGARFNWCASNQTNRLYPFDIYCPGYGVIIEVDGPHHFQNVGSWGDNLIERQLRDVYKMQCAVQNGLRVIRICQADVWKNQTVWKQRLISDLIGTNRPVIMMANDSAIYDEHWRLADY